MSNHRNMSKVGALAASAVILAGLSTMASAGSPGAAVRVAPAVPLRAAAPSRPAGIDRIEAARLRHQHQQYLQMKQLAQADGEITRREQARLGHMASHLRRLIHAAKND